MKHFVTMDTLLVQLKSLFRKSFFLFSPVLLLLCALRRWTCDKISPSVTFYRHTSNRIAVVKWKIDFIGNTLSLFVRPADHESHNFFVTSQQIQSSIFTVVRTFYCRLGTRANIYCYIFFFPCVDSNDKFSHDDDQWCRHTSHAQRKFIVFLGKEIRNHE